MSGGEGGLQARLQHARELTAKRDFRGVINLLISVDRASLLLDPEACILLASAYNILYMPREATDLLVATRGPIEATGDASFLRRWQNLYGNQRLIAGELDEAEALFHAALVSAERDQHQRVLATASGNLGIVSGMRGEVDRALGFYNRAISASQRRGAALEIARTNHNIGVTMRDWGRGREAFPYFMHAADFYSERGVPEERVFTAAERAILVVEFGDPEMAEQLARTALERCSFFSNAAIEMSANRALGIVLRDTDRGDEARPYLLDAIEKAEIAPYPILRADAQEEMAILEADKRNVPAAELHRDKALAIFAAMGLVKHCERFARRFDQRLERGVRLLQGDRPV